MVVYVFHLLTHIQFYTDKCFQKLCIIWLSYRININLKIIKFVNQKLTGSTVQSKPNKYLIYYFWSNFYPVQ